MMKEFCNLSIEKCMHAEYLVSFLLNAWEMCVCFYKKVYIKYFIKFLRCIFIVVFFYIRSNPWLKVIKMQQQMYIKYNPHNVRFFLIILMKVHKFYTKRFFHFSNKNKLNTKWCLLQNIINIPGIKMNYIWKANGYFGIKITFSSCL